MAEDLEKKGHQAFVDEDFEEAVNLYTEALSLEPQNAAVLSSRAAAHTKLENYTDAVADASKAIELNPKASKAYLRKGMACFYLEEYQTAKAAFEAGQSLDPKASGFKTWITKCDAKLREENGKAGEQAVPVSSPTSSGNEDEVITPMETVAEAKSAKDVSSEKEPASVAVPAPASSSAAPALPPPKFRHEWYQTLTHLVVSIFAKGIKEEDLKVNFGEQILSVVINCGDEEPFAFQLRLFGKVVPAQCRYTLLRTKVEIRLTKAESMQWKQLEYDPKLQQTVRAVVVPTEEDKVKYPSSSKKPAKDWDKLEAEVKKEEKDEKLEGDAALNKLFREIYSNADEDTRRAMNKSFVESNGTVLSTNWKDVGKKKIEGSAPTGMEMKKWEL